MSRDHPLAPHRVIPAAVILVLGLVAVLAVKGPDWYQRFYLPLDYRAQIAENARANGLDPYLVAAIINVESGFDPDEVSDAGAVGLMQLMPDTAVEVAHNRGLQPQPTVESLKQPDLNIRIGTLHLAALHREFPSREAVLAAYNAGSGTVARWAKSAEATGRPFDVAVEYPETRAYIAEVLEQRDAYERLYPDAFKE